MDVMEAIHSRRSIRRFLSTPIEHEDLLRILDAARMAPSGGNLQPWHFIVVENREIINRLLNVLKRKIDELPGSLRENMENWEENAAVLTYRLKKNSLFFSRAPVTIFALVRILENPFVHVLTRKGLSLWEANQHMGFIEIQSVASAIQNLLLAAHSLGYGACWMNVPFIAKDEFMRILHTTPPWDLIAMIPVGIPDPAYSPPKRIRKEIEEIVTFC